MASLNSCDSTAEDRSLWTAVTPFRQRLSRLVDCIFENRSWPHRDYGKQRVNRPKAEQQSTEALQQRVVQLARDPCPLISSGLDLHVELVRQLPQRSRCTIHQKGCESPPRTARGTKPLFASRPARLKSLGMRPRFRSKLRYYSADYSKAIVAWSEIRILRLAVAFAHLPAGS